MEIRVTTRMKGARWRDRILQRWGTRDALEQAAETGDPEAGEDLFTLERLEEDPARLEADHERTIVSSLAGDRLARLTEARLALVDLLATCDDPPNVSQLARRAGRDKKNVSQDLELLEELGLVERIEHGREKRVRLRGSKISIELEVDEPATA